jgi:2-amino-4-hydroxy-6-hydroxymethyldihydropteridine diphosphokinase
MICFSLGSNLGDRLFYLQMAVDALEEIFGKAIMVSPVYETEGWRVDNHPNYLNAVICFNSSMAPKDVLDHILSIEIKLGRERKPDTIEPRTIDIDILFYDDLILKKENLIIPHPHLKYRKFVLLPLSGIMGDFLYPGSGTSINQLLKDCDDKSAVCKTELRLTL